jgi:HD-like signal output (HDOD) protein
MKNRILFVDDDPLVLQGFQRMLRPMRDQWEMMFADGGEAALALMEAGAFDVVVTDMRMPGMNGAQLLAEVMRRFPATVRLVLSGHADQDLVAQCLGVAHQYIAKPCDAEQLKTMVLNACQIGGTHVSAKVKELLGSIDRLPSLPALYFQLEKALTMEGSSAQELGKIIQQDMAMTAKILKLVNSSYFGLRRTIFSVQEAVTYLGTETIKVLVLANFIFERAEPLPTRNLGLEQLWHHSLAVAKGGRAIAEVEGASLKIREQTFVSGILEDVGILVLATHFPEAYDRTIAMVLEEKIQIPTAELWEFGLTHAEVGAYLLGLWGLPAPILKIVGQHHHQPPLQTLAFASELALHVADIFTGERGGHPFFRTDSLEKSALMKPEFTDKLAEWKKAVPGPEDSTAEPPWA